MWNMLPWLVSWMFTIFLLCCSKCECHFVFQVKLAFKLKYCKPNIVSILSNILLNGRIECWDVRMLSMLWKHAMLFCFLFVLSYSFGWNICIRASSKCQSALLSLTVHFWIFQGGLLEKRHRVHCCCSEYWHYFKHIVFFYMGTNSIVVG